MKTSAPNTTARLCRHALLACCALILLGGCASPTDKDGRLRHRQIVVAPSALNWLEVGYFPRANDPLVVSPCRLSFFGSGEVQFKTGRSPQVWSSFSQEVDHPHWNEVIADRLHIGPDEMCEVLQTFVDEGVVPPRAFKIRRQEVKPPYVNIAGMIGMEKIRIATDNPYLVGLVEEALENFEPALKRAALAQQADETPQRTK